MSFAEKTAATDASPDLNSSIYRRVGVHVHVHLPSRQDAHAQVPWRHIVEGADWRVGVASDYVKKAEGIMNGRDVRSRSCIVLRRRAQHCRRAARQVVGRNMEVFRSIFMFKKIKVKGGCSVQGDQALHDQGRSQNASGMETFILATLLCTSAGDFAPGMTHATQSSRSSGNWRAAAMRGR